MAILKHNEAPLDAKPAQRQSSEPAPESDEFPEKHDSFKRQASAPQPDGRDKWSMNRSQQAKLMFHPTRQDSRVELIESLRKGAIKDKRQAPWALIAAIVGFNIIGKIGDAVGPAMVGSWPVSLLLLNASNTHCILTTTSVPFMVWIILCVGRRFCEDPLYFFAGWKYRESCLDMLRGWSPDMAEGFDKAEDLFRKNLYVAVAVNPGATVCSLAGASRMPPIAFFTLNIGSTAGQLIVMRYVCLMFPDRIDQVLGLIKQYMMILLAVMIGITLVGALPMLRKKKED